MTLSTSVGQRRHVARRALFALSTILAGGMALPATAQTVKRYAVDANGVDPISGAFELRLPVFSIGSGASELPLIVQGRARNNWTRAYAHQTVQAGKTIISITLDQGYDYFSSADGYARSIIGTGATLSVGSFGAITYTTSDGLKIDFGDPTGGASQQPGICHNLTSTCDRWPIGASRPGTPAVSYDWIMGDYCTTQNDPLDPGPSPDDPVVCTTRWRLGSVTNQAGYRIAFGYASDDANVPSAWDENISATFMNIAVPAAAWPTVSYASDYSVITTPGGNTWHVTYDQNNRVTGIRRPGATSDATSVSYGTGGVTSVTRDGITTNYSRTVSGTTVTTAVSDALGHKTTIASDLSIYQPVSVTNPLMHVTGYTHDAAGRLTEQTMPEGDKVQYVYDARSNVVETRRKAKPGTGLPDIVTTAGYDTQCTNLATCNRPNWTKDAKGAQTDYAYDSSTGLVTAVTAPAPTSGVVRPQTRYSYTTVSGVALLTGTSQCRTQATCASTSDEVKATITYNANLLPAGVTSGAGDNSLTATTAYGYDPIGNLVSVDGPLAGAGDTTTYRYNADREMLGAIAPDPDGSGPQRRRAVRIGYNANGQVASTEQGIVNGTTDADWAGFASAQQVSTSYDANGRKVAESTVAGGATYGVTQYSYDALGRPECAVVRMNRAAFGGLPGACSLGTEGVDGPDRITRTVYDQVGRVYSVTSANGTADASTETATYTANGRVHHVIDGNGNATRFDYDGFDRLVATVYPSRTVPGDTNPADYDQLSYDANGNVTSRRQRDGQLIGYSYDALDRMTLMDLNGAGIDLDISYNYDLQGRLISAGNWVGHLTIFGYDALGRPVNEQTTYGGVKVSTFDLAGRRTRLTWPDGFYVTYDYDAAGQVTAIRENGSAVLASFTYDDLGRRTSLTRGNGLTTSYGYDPASRLSSLTQDLAGTAADVTVGLAYNAASQIASRTASNDLYAWTGAANGNVGYTANGLNQYTQTDGAAPGYDGKGNLNAIGGASYGYSQRGQLFSAPGATLYYDPLSRLDLVYDGSANTTFDYDGNRLATEGAYQQGGIRRRYVFGPGTDEPLVWYEGPGTGDKR